MSKEHVLIVEDDRMQATLLSRLLNLNGIASTTAAEGSKALETLEQSDTNISAIILDILLPDMNGMEVMREVVQRFPEHPVIFLTAIADTKNAIEATKLGAFDYIVKPFDPDRIIITIRNAIAQFNLRAEIKKSRLVSSKHIKFEDLIGKEGGLKNAINAGLRIAQTDIPALILGETGVGKDVFARALHGESKRHNHPFISINCAAIPEQLIESILFGHEKGAFTGANEKTPGKFREAEGGTIFLDEIGDMPISAQTRLLRVLQQHEIEPVGSSKAIPVDVRIISATNRDLRQDITKGRFREDLFYRLNVMPITLPPLRQRLDDIPDLIEYFIQRFLYLDNLPHKKFGDAAIKVLQKHTWPGNIRELENILRRCLVMTDKRVIGTADILPFIDNAEQISENRHTTTNKFINLYTDAGIHKTFNQIETEILHVALYSESGNVTRAANKLGIAKSTFYRKINTKDK